VQQEDQKYFTQHIRGLPTGTYQRLILCTASSNCQRIITPTGQQLKREDIMSTKHISTSIASLAIVLASLAGSSTASAATASAYFVPTMVNYTNGHLVIGAPTTVYEAYTSLSGCASTPVDTQKIWASLAQGNYLAGKTLYVYYDVCTLSNGNKVNMISTVSAQ
jgi:hypothetical protein